jgi:hypothetical protein
VIISEQLRRTNIAEYIIYMWQTEDMVRSFNFDINLIQKHIIDQYDTDLQMKQNIKNWYEGIIKMSELENIKSSGHLQVITNIVNDLNELHLWLLSQPEEIVYRFKFHAAVPHINELSIKMQGTKKNDIDICLHGLYGVMLLKMKHVDISQGTMTEIETFRELISLLAAKYKDREENPEKYIPQ